MEIHLLGPLVVRVDGSVVAIRGAKERATLSLLALREGSVVSTSELVDALWGLAPPSSALRGLRNYVANLRRVLPAGVVVTVPGGYQADLAPGAVDALRFERAVASAREAADTATTMRILQEALGWWRGPPLPDLAGTSVGGAEATRLSELRATAQEELYQAQLAQGEHAALVADLEAAVAAEPLRERRWAQLMVALYRSGRQADALRAFQRLRRQLAEELGIEPSAALVALDEAVVLQKPELDWADSVPPASGVRPAQTALAVSMPFLHPVVASGAASLPGALRRAARRNLVGRRAELEHITAPFGRAQEERPVRLVVGEAGVGKTLLVAAAADVAARAGALVLFGRCDEGLRVPYQPFVEALRAYVTATPSDVLATQLGSTGSELARLIPELTARVPGLPPPPTSTDPETERWRLFQAAANLLGAMAVAQPVMLVIDDLHWAEPATLLLLRYVARADIDSLVVVAATRREEQAEPEALVEALADLAREHRLDTIALAGLNDQEVAAVVANRLDRPPAPAFAAALQGQTGGNPFFIHEVISHLIDLGMLTPRAADWPTPTLIRQSGAPQGVQYVLSRRVGKLSAPARETLSVAAVAGATFQATDLVGASGGDLNRTLMTLEEVAKSGLIREQPPRPGCYRFAHDLVRHTLYEALSSLRRAQLHWGVAEAIRVTGTQPPDRLDELAYHYRNGIDVGDPAIVVYWLQQAGDLALAHLAFEEAIAHYRAALDALDRCPDDVNRRYDLLAGLGESADAISDYEASHRAWLAAAGIARTTKVPTRFFRALFGHENLMRIVLDGHRSDVSAGGEDQTLEDLIDEGLELAGQEDSPERARLLAWKGAAMRGPATPRSREQREALVLEALAMARRTRSYAAQQAVLGTLGELLWGSSQAIELMAVQKEQVDLLHTYGFGRDGVWPYRGMALAAIALGRRDEADSALEQAERLARSANRRLELHGVLTINAAVATAEGRFDDAERLAADIGELCRAGGRTMTLSHQATVCAIHAAQGQADKVIDTLRDLPDDPSPSAVAWRAMVAGVCADVGYFDDAAERFGNLVANFAAIPRDSSFPLTIRYLAETCVQLGTAVQAAQLLPEVEPYSGQLLVVDRGISIEAAADRSLGQLYALLDRPNEADAHFDMAYRLEISMGFTALAARTRYWHGRLVAHADYNTRRERLTDARVIATKLRMHLLQRQATESLNELA